MLRVNLTQWAFFLVLIASLPCGANVEASKLLRQILSLSQINLNNLNKDNLIYQAEKGVYLFRGAKAKPAHELETAKRVAQATGLNILLFGSINGLGNMPGFDGLLFAGDGSVFANITMKGVHMITTDRYDPSQNIRKRIQSGAKGTLSLIEQNGLDDERSKWGPLPEARQAMGYILGERNHQIERQTLVVVDASRMTEWEPKLKQSSYLQIEERGSRGALALRIVDLFSPSSSMEQVDHVIIVFQHSTFLASRRKGFRELRAPFKAVPSRQYAPSCQFIFRAG